MCTHTIDDTELLTVSQAAQRLKCSERHIWRLIAAKQLKVFRHSGLTRVTKKSIHDFINDHVSDAPEATPPCASQSEWKADRSSSNPEDQRDV